MPAAENATLSPAAPNPSSSGTPLLTETKAPESSSTSSQAGLLDKGKRMLGLGKKKQGETPAAASSAGPSPPLSPPLADSTRRSPRGSPRIYPASVAASPNRRIRSTSPGLASPASSQIFERNVQDSVTELDRSELSPHLPTHIQTEDYIPPVLEASSLAITDDHLNPDEVEIVMHAAHQPAAAVVAGSRDSLYSPSQDEVSVAATSTHPDAAEPNYGSIDTADVRRLSFISFADVVQAEQVENDRDAVQVMSLASTANRSPSPMRSPTSSHGFSVSPPTSGATSEKGAEYVSGKVLRSPQSPTHGTHSPPLQGELQIETMRQALRKTGSGDLGGARTQPLSATSTEATGADKPPFK